MLTHIDVFLGVALVMLAVSLLITIVTQMVSLACNFRGRQLRRGLGELFDILQLGSDGKILATAILQHPLIANGLGKARLVAAISKVDLKSLLANAGTLHNKLPIDEGKLAAAIAGVETWFDATMSRVSHRFALHTRLVTIGGALVAAFALQLDAFGLVTRLYADSDLRARMAGAADVMVSQSERVLATPSTFADAATALVKEKGVSLSPPATSIASREQAHAWIRGAVRDATEAQALTARYDAIFQDALGPSIKNLMGQVTEIKGTLAGAGLQLVPTPYRPFNYASLWAVLGVLTSAGLLSLGAPFWFNALKAVSNLRPVVAATVQGRDDSAKSKQSPSNAG